jgi:hypothetical protein
MKMMKTLSLLVIINAIVLSGCGLGGGLDNARTLAEEFLDDRFVSGGIGSEEFYSDLFWKYTRAEDWEYIRNMVQTNLGELQSYMLKSWKIQSKAKMGDISGTIVVLIYDTEYEYGNGQEKITLMKGFWDSDFQIIGHYFESDIFA